MEQAASCHPKVLKFGSDKVNNDEISNLGHR